MSEVPRQEVRLMVVDPLARLDCVVPFARFPGYFDEGDLLVVNDAATMPASLRATTGDGASLEVRLFDGDGATWRAVLFDAGDWRTKTEDRAAPPKLAPGSELRFGPVCARITEVSELSPRLVRLEISGAPGELWSEVYSQGAPIQYAYRGGPAPLWSVQNVYATRPWAAENPSAGRPLSWELLLELRRRGAKVVALTHATGLSSTGDATLDAALPLPERCEIPAATAEAVNSAVRTGRRVIAVGTSVMRALESSALADGKVTAGPAIASLLITEAHRPRVVHGLLTGVHSPQESHYRLLRSLVDGQTLAHATQTARDHRLVEHELGDAVLLLPGSLRRKVSRDVDLRAML
jgi:S-adenosylmethionine:tRNA ribosyltransferase-isomerase